MAGTAVAARAVDLEMDVVYGGDDGVELDFSTRNVQAHHNLLTNVNDGVSFQFVYDGPVYAYKNIIYNVNFNVGPYKLKPEASCNDGVFIFNNTALNANRGWTNFSGCGNSINLFNNIFTGDGTFQDAIRADTSNWSNLAWDYNAYAHDGWWQIGNIWEQSFTSWKANQGKNSVLLAGQQVFKNAPLMSPQNGLGAWKDPNGKDFSLAAGSSAIDAAKLLPSITDGFTGSAPDIGAYEQGIAAPQYGVRQ